MERIGVPNSAFAIRGVHNICLGPRAKNPALRGERVVLAIFDKKDWVVRELREEFIETGSDSGVADEKGDSKRASRIVDVDLNGKVTVLHDDAQELFGEANKWMRVVDAWSRKFGITQEAPQPA